MYIAHIKSDYHRRMKDIIIGLNSNVTKNTADTCTYAGYIAYNPGLPRRFFLQLWQKTAAKKSASKAWVQGYRIYT